MHPLIHFITSLALFLILIPFYGYNALFVFISGFLADLDHFYYYYLKFKKIEVKKAINYFLDIPKRNAYSELQERMFIFHSVELLVLCIILSFYLKAFTIITLGLLLHYALDLAHEQFVVKKQVKHRSYILKRLLSKD